MDRHFQQIAFHVIAGILVSLFAARLSATPAPATATVSSATSSASGLSIRPSVSTGVQFKPEYFDEPGQSGFVSLSLATTPSERTTLTLSSGRVILPRDPAPGTDRVRTGNPGLRLGVSDILRSAKGSSRLAPSLDLWTSATSGIAKRSRETGLTGTIRAGSDFGLTLPANLDLSLSVDYAKPLYKETLSASGAPNPNHELGAGIELGASPLAALRLFVGTGVEQQILHSTESTSSAAQIRAGDGDSTWSFTNAVGFSLQMTESTRLLGSLETSNDQLRPDGRRVPWSLYTRDVTEGSLTVSHRF